MTDGAVVLAEDLHPREAYATSRRSFSAPAPADASEIVVRDIGGETGRFESEYLDLPDGVSLGLFRYDLSTPLRIEQCQPTDDVVLNLMLAGYLVTRLQGARRDSIDRKGEATLIGPLGQCMRSIQFTQPGKYAVVRLAMSGDSFHAYTKSTGVSLHAQTAQRLRSQYGRIADRRKMSPRLSLAANQLERCTLEGPLRAAYLKTKVMEILTLYAADLSEERSARTRRPVQPATAYRLAKARRMILDNLADAPSIAELANSVKLSESTLTHGFRDYFGTSVHRFKIDARLERGFELIQTAPHRKLADVAGEVGFQCPSRFARVFFQKYGVYPKELRKSCLARDVSKR